jgi:hypothetical protein
VIITGNLKRWIITYGTVIEDSALPYYKVCDALEAEIKARLDIEFKDRYTAVEDSRDGEGFSERFMIQSDYDLKLMPPEMKNVKVNEEEYDMDILEIEEYEKIYSKNFQNLFDSLKRCLNQNPNPFTQLGMEIVANAIRCYEEELDDPAVIMCRTAIDSSLYLASIWERDNDEYKERKPAPFNENKDVHWGELRNAAKKFEFFNDMELKFINDNVRELGNFAAHIGQSQVSEGKERERIYGKQMANFVKDILAGKKVNPRDIPPGAKLHTSRSESTSAINRTITFICKLAKKYNTPSENS